MNEWDFDWASSNNNNNINNIGVITPAGTIVVTNNNDRWITTLAARFGWAVDHWLFYGKAGGGWVNNNQFTITNLNTGASFTCGTFSTNTSCGNNTGGWLVGAGFEYAFANNWTVKLEYDYLGLGNRTFPCGRYVHYQQPQCPDVQSWIQLPVQLGRTRQILIADSRLTSADDKGSGSNTGAHSISLPPHTRARCALDQGQEPDPAMERVIDDRCSSPSTR